MGTNLYDVCENVQRCDVIICARSMSKINHDTNKLVIRMYVTIGRRIGILAAKNHNK